MFQQPLLKDTRSPATREGRAVLLRLKEQIQRHLATATATGGDAGLVRLSVPADGFWGSALGWLSVQQMTPRVFWQGRDDERQVAGIGCADEISVPWDNLPTAINRCRDVIGHHPHARYFGGFAFDPRPHHDLEWEEFGPGRLILPLIELVREGSRTWLVCNLLLRGGVPSERKVRAILAAIDSVNPDEGAETDQPVVNERSDLPAFLPWQRLVARAIRSCRAGVLKKVVMARHTRLSCSAPLEPARLLDSLRKQTRNRYYFLFQPVADRAFLGVSPERLFFRAGEALFTEALAGTFFGQRADIPAGELPADCDKEQREQNIVLDFVRHRLDPFCQVLEGEETPSLLKLGDKQHLISRLRTQLNASASDSQLLEALHPTPAVAGVPDDIALNFLRQQEPFQRGWYAGPVGWVGGEGAEFSVAIRSALVDGDTLNLFAGAGILAESDPVQEWHEVEAKISEYLNLLAG